MFYGSPLVFAGCWLSLGATSGCGLGREEEMKARASLETPSEQSALGDWPCVVQRRKTLHEDLVQLKQGTLCICVYKRTHLYTNDNNVIHA